MAFLKGRSIQECVLLMNEVLHSFRANDYDESVFVLKADLFKAFDTLGWAFLALVLQKFEFPQPLTKLIMSCVTRSKFSIKLNGMAGSGFITPERGLRQGCPLSPYLFILSMEVLSKLLSEALTTGSIQGVTLANGAPTITHSLYAGDLVLFGQVKDVEIDNLARIMDLFGRLSGLRINNDKSVMWFSRKVTQRMQEIVLRVFPAKGPTDSTTYLGHPMPKGKVLSRHYTSMVDKVEKQFSG